MLGLFTKKHKRSDGKMLFLFFAVAATLLVIGLVLQRSSGPRTAVHETPPEAAVDPVDALPDGATTPAVTAIEPSIDPTYVYAYMRGGDVEAAFVKWDRREGEYRLHDTVAADELGLAGGTAPRAGIARTGWEVDPVVSVTARHGAYTDATVLLVREGDALRVLRRIDAEGAIRPAMFLSGASGRNFAEFHFEDADGDGVMEVVATEGTMMGDEEGGAVVRDAETLVYRWDGALLRYDERMSWAFSLSDKVFPEPEAPAAE